MSDDYQELHGHPPTTRSMDPILNVHGITKFKVAYGVDNKGGKTLINPAIWKKVSNIQVYMYGFHIVYSFNYQILL